MDTRISSQATDIDDFVTSQSMGRHRRVALVFALVLVVMMMCIVPVAQLQGPNLPQFFAIHASIALFADVITAYLFFGQFIRTRLLPVLVLASTYLFSSLILVVYLVTFPDVLFPAGTFYNGTPTWAWIFWHIGFPLGFLVYGLVEKRHQDPLVPSVLFWLTATTSGFVILMVTLASFAALYWYVFLPVVIVGGDYHYMLTSGVAPIMFIIHLIACIVLYMSRRGSILNHWLFIANLASMFDTVTAVVAAARYSWGWYLARIDAIIAATVVLCVLLHEVNRLYNRIAQQYDQITEQTGQMQQQNEQLAEQKEQLEQKNNQLAEQKEQLEQQNERLVRQYDAQRNFISVTSHEFRTALTCIQGFSEIIIDDAQGDEETVSYASDIHTEAQRLSRLISSLLDLERMQAGRAELLRVPVLLDPLLPSIVHRMRAVTPDRIFHLTLPPDLPPFLGDEDKFTQVVINLLNNAVKYSAPGSSIYTSAALEENKLHITVRDEGIGIPTNRLEHIFEEYSRLENDHTRYISGTGLGLSIARQIVKMHNGKIYAESAYGEGSTFHILLPVHNPAALPPRTSALV